MWVNPPTGTMHRSPPVFCRNEVGSGQAWCSGSAIIPVVTALGTVTPSCLPLLSAASDLFSFSFPHSSAFWEESAISSPNVCIFKHSFLVSYHFWAKILTSVSSSNYIRKIHLLRMLYLNIWVWNQGQISSGQTECVLHLVFTKC